MSSLKGLRVLNTRPLEQGEELSQAITVAGGVALACPALTIGPSNGNWLASLPPLRQVDKAIFTSVNAVVHCFQVLEKEHYVWPESIEVIAIGQATEKALKKYNITALVPLIADSEHLLVLESMRDIQQKTILLVKGEGGRTLITENLIASGANLHIVEVYKRQKPRLPPQYLHSLWHNDAVDIILFTSQQAMQNIFTLFGKNAKAWLVGKPCLVISERLAKAAALLGMKTIMICSPESILKTLHQFNQGLTHGP